MGHELVSVLQCVAVKAELLLHIGTRCQVHIGARCQVPIGTKYQVCILESES